MSRALALLLALCALVLPSIARAHGRVDVRVPGRVDVRVPGRVDVRVPGRVDVRVPGRVDVRVPGRASGAVVAELEGRVGSPEFLQRDPEGYADSVNVYAALANDPINNRDPTGRAVCGEFCRGKETHYARELLEFLGVQETTADRVDRILGATQPLWEIPVSIGIGVGAGAAVRAPSAVVVPRPGVPQQLELPLPGQQLRMPFLDEAVAAPTARAPVVPRVAVGEPGEQLQLPFPPEAAPPPGSFSVVDWKGYPAQLPQPKGPFRLLEGSEYQDARAAANKANAAIHREDPTLAGKDIHELQPVKFGGSPTDRANKVPLTRAQHTPATSWWKALQRYMESHR